MNDIKTFFKNLNQKRIKTIFNVEYSIQNKLSNKKPLKKTNGNKEKSISGDLKFEKVTLIYPNGFRALRDINFTVKHGEFIALIGNSGSGKTSILNTIAAMYKISKGKISLGDTFISSNSKRKYILSLRRQIGFVFQHKNVIEGLLVYDNVKSGLENKLSKFEKLTGIILPVNKKKIYDALALVKLESLMFEKVKNLSGGQQQRVALARALVSNPKLILADEPVSALDVVNQEAVMNTFHRINKVEGITVLVNLHHIDLALKYADKIIGVKDGEVVFFDKTTKATPLVIKKIFGKEIKDITPQSIKDSLKYNKNL